MHHARQAKGKITHLTSDPGTQSIGRLIRQFGFGGFPAWCDCLAQSQCQSCPSLVPTHAKGSREAGVVLNAIWVSLTYTNAVRRL